VFKRAVIARNLHKWFGLLVGLQLLIWLGSGLYMVAVDIDFIHGDPLVRNMQQAVTLPDAPAPGVNNLRAKYPDATRIGLIPVMGKTHYSVITPTQRYLLDPISGRVISPLDEQTARQIAKYHFNGDVSADDLGGDDPIIRATLIESNPPMEIQTRRLPLWRIDFDDRFSTSFYIDPYTGALATRRHQYWRIFDFMWMLHIMDYEERADAHNPLLVTAQVTGLIFTLTGIWLLLYSFNQRRKNRAGAR
jgi:uncharacterized iron-regulated membrane protein